MIKDADTELRAGIEERLAQFDPALELLAVERPGGDALRLFIDHPDGVDLTRCERVTRELGDMLSTYSLEVSSPGLDRPLTKPDHFRRFVGRRVRVRTREPIGGSRNFTGTLEGVEADCVRLACDQGEVEIPFDGVRRSNLVPELPEVGSR